MLHEACDYIKSLVVSEDVTTIKVNRLVTFGEGGVDLELETAQEINALSEGEVKGSFELAEKIQRWIGNQDYYGEPLLHASVCCDHAGRMNFIKVLRKLIEETDTEIAKRIVQEIIDELSQVSEDTITVADIMYWLGKEGE